MNRKSFFKIGILAAALGLLLLMVIYDQKGDRLNKCIVSEDEYQKILSTRAPATSFSGSISLNDEELFFDRQKNFVLYSLVQKDKWAYNPVVKVDNGSDNMRIAFMDEEINDDLIKENGSIRFVVFDECTYFESELKCTTLPIMSISTKDFIPESKSESTSMCMKLFDNGDFSKVQSSDGTIHVRGASSVIYPKKNYRISLNKTSSNGEITKNKLSLLNMPSDDDWILYGIYDDPEKVRNVLSTNLWKSSCAKDNSYLIDTGTEYKFIELFINEEYNGLYALGYPLQDSQLGIKEKGNRVLYKKNYDYGQKIFFDIYGNRSSYEMQGKNQDAGYSFLVDYIDHYEKSESTDELWRMIDENNMLDYCLYLNLVQGWDNLFRNQYLLITENDNNDLKVIYIPWDMDMTWGMGRNKVLYDMDYSDNLVYTLGVPGYLLQYDSVNVSDLLNRKYSKLRLEEWSDQSILNMIEQYEEDIYDSGAYLREKERWPEAEYIDDSLKLSRLKQYVLNRLHFMDDNSDCFKANVETNYSSKYGLYNPLSFATFLYGESDDIKILQIQNLDFWKDDYYKDTLLDLGVSIEDISYENSLRGQLAEKSGLNTDDISEHTDIIVVIDKRMYTAENFFTNGSVLSTPEGDFSYFETEEGAAGLYFDGNEVITEEAGESDFDVRLIRIDKQSHQVTSVDENGILYAIFSGI